MWLVLSLLTFVMWGTYTIFGNEATKVHGEKVTFFFETVGFVAISLVILFWATGDFRKITGRSFLCGTLMAALSAGGFYIMVWALKLAPDKLPLITLITGMYPVLTVVIAARFQGQPLGFHQKVGLACAAVGLLLVNLPAKYFSR